MSKIGLHKAKVEVVKHDPSWKQSFNEEKLTLTKTLADVALDIQHVGSTSIEGLDAKPIIDIAVAITSWEQINLVCEKLKNSYWIDCGWNVPFNAKENDGDYLFVKESEPEIRTHHLHLVQINAIQWNSYIRFRDALRKNPSLLQSYAQLKNELSDTYANDRKSYTAAKDSFIKSVISKT